MNAFNIVIIALGICALCVFWHSITEAKEAGNDAGLFITHEELGKMREEWIEYGMKKGKEEVCDEKRIAHIMKGIRMIIEDLYEEDTRPIRGITEWDADLDYLRKLIYDD